MKKYLLLFIFPFVISCSHKTYVLYYEKEEISRPLSMNVNNFWSLDLDSVSVIDRTVYFSEMEDKYGRTEF
jgi:hypothetical protein